MIDQMGRPKKYEHPPNMTFDTSCNRFIVRNPKTGKKKKFTEEGAATKAAEALNQWLECERQAEALDAGRPTIAGVVNKWKSDRMQFMPWDEGTRKAMVYKMDRIHRELGHRLVIRTDCMFLEDWLKGFCKTADQFNKWRYAMVLLWKFAISRNLADTNEPERIEQRSTSKKLDANKKVRRQLDIEGFKAIHEKAPSYLQIAMEQSLVTLLARLEICNIRYTDYRDGRLYVIRDKVSGDSDMAFIKIAVTPQLDDIRRRSLDDTLSPYLVHRKPESQRREWIEGKPHWTYVNPEYLSKAFAEARDASGRYATLEPRERPTFHEIRGLGARLYRAQGVSESAIQALMTHSNKRTTQIYLERGVTALSDDDYNPVTASMVLSEVGIKG